MNRTFSVAIMVASVVLTFQSSFAAELEPRKLDTLWTRSTSQIPGVSEFIGCAMGGTPRVLIAGTHSGDLIAFDAMTGDTLRRVISQLGSIYNISFARNANIFSTTSPFTVKIWRWPEMDVIREIRFPESASGTNRHFKATLTSDGKRILIGGYNYSGVNGGLYNVETGEQIHSFIVSPVIEPKITPDDRYSLTFTNVVQVHDLTTGQKLAELPGGGSGPTSMDITDDGRYVVVSSEPEDDIDGALVFYDMVERRQVYWRVFDHKEGRAGTFVAFVPGSTGYFVTSATGGKSYIDYHAGITDEASKRFYIGYFGSRFSIDRMFRYGAGGVTTYVSHFDLSAVSVAPFVTQHEHVVLKPNPSNGDVTVSGIIAVDGPANWHVSDVSGRIVTSGTTYVESGTFQLHALSLMQGTYVLRLLRNERLIFSHTIQR